MQQSFTSTDKSMVVWVFGGVGPRQGNSGSSFFFLFKSLEPEVEFSSVLNFISVERISLRPTATADNCIPVTFDGV